MTLMSVCQWSGVEIITASTSFRARTSRKSLVMAQSSLSYLASTMALALRMRYPSTSQTITTFAASSLRYLLRFQSTPWPPTPMKPTVILLLGAFTPKTEDGTMRGREMAVAVERMKCLRESCRSFLQACIAVPSLARQFHEASNLFVQVMRRVGARDLHGEIPCNRRVGRPTGPSHSLPGVVVSLYSMHNMKSPQRCSWPKSELDIQ